MTVFIASWTLWEVANRGLSRLTETARGLEYASSGSACLDISTHSSLRSILGHGRIYEGQGGNSPLCSHRLPPGSHCIIALPHYFCERTIPMQSLQSLLFPCEAAHAVRCYSNWHNRQLVKVCFEADSVRIVRSLA